MWTFVVLGSAILPPLSVVMWQSEKYVFSIVLAAIAIVFIISILERITNDRI